LNLYGQKFVKLHLKLPIQKKKSQLFLLAKIIMNIDDSRPLEEILDNGISPKASLKKYIVEWEDFLKFSKTNEPKELHYLKYFDSMRQQKEYESF